LQLLPPAAAATPTSPTSIEQRTVVKNVQSEAPFKIIPGGAVMLTGQDLPHPDVMAALRQVYALVTVP
jgi:hypothetical protein